MPNSVISLHGHFTVNPAFLNTDHIPNTWQHFAQSPQVISRTFILCTSIYGFYQHYISCSQDFPLLGV